MVAKLARAWGPNARRQRSATRPRSGDRSYFGVFLVYNSAMSSKQLSTRRQFLRGEAAVQALANLAQGRWTDAPDEFESEDPASQPYLIQLARSAMACQFEIYLNAGQYPQGNEAAI